MNEEKTNKNENSFDEQLDKFSKGTLKLFKPIIAAGKEIAELNYDFRKMTGWEYANALDSDTNAGSIFKITNKQALALFAASAAKETTAQNESGETYHPLDAQDIRERIGIDDTIKATQLASVFFIGSARAGSKRTSNE